MSEEPRPSAHPPDQRRGDGAPAWWSQLDRGDLPDDAGKAERAAPRRAVAAGPPAAPRRRLHIRGWLINVAALAVALLVIMLGVGVDSARGALLVALVFGVPMILVAITATVAVRRTR